MLKLIIVNLITTIRILATFLLIPCAIIYGYYITGIVGIFVYLTDFIDGFLARKWHVSTFFGAFLDGMADKLFTIVYVGILTFKIPWMIVPLIMEIIILIIGYNTAFKGNNIHSFIIGKIKAAVLDILMILSYIVVDFNNFKNTFLPFIRDLSNYEINIFLTLFIIIIIVFQIFTIISYMFHDIKSSKNNNEYQKILSESKNLKDMITKRKKILNELFTSLMNNKKVLFDSEYYYKHKNDNIKDLLLK